jgi:hypothetical protein
MPSVRNDGKTGRRGDAAKEGHEDGEKGRHGDGEKEGKRRKGGESR